MALQWIKDRVRYFNRDVLNPLMLTFAGRSYSPYAMIEHVGRKSGRIYTTPVLAMEDGDEFVIPLPYGANTDWCRNVLAANGAVIVVRGRAYRVGYPEVVPPSKALRAFPNWTRWLLDLVETDRYLRVKRLSDSPEPPSVYEAIVAGYPITRAVLILGALLLAVILSLLLRWIGRRIRRSNHG